RRRQTRFSRDWSSDVCSSDLKDKGRSAESVINTLIVHMNRYAKSYSKSAIYGSDFSTQEEFIFLINLKAFGAMSKMELIKKNIRSEERRVGKERRSRRCSDHD